MQISSSGFGSCGHSGADQVLGVAHVNANLFEFKTIVPGPGATVAPAAGQITIGTQRHFSWYLSGTVSVATDAGSWFVAQTPMSLTRADVVSKTAPTGSSLIVDVLRSTNGGTSFTSLWSVNAGNKPTIAAGQTQGNTTSFDQPTLNVGDILRLDVDQVGSSTAGANVTVELI